MKFKLGYRPALDGLRGLAILLVLGSHSLLFMKGGFIGVDIFFVLSGFLITTILIEEKDACGRISLRDFYVRRILRLFPALLSVVAASSILCLYIGYNANTVVRDGFFAVSYLSNWARAFEWSDMDYLGHTWSLAIEEQFYILWPITLLLILRLRSRALMLALTCVLIAALASYRVYAVSMGADVYVISNRLEARLDLLGGVSLMVIAGVVYYFRWKNPLTYVIALPLVSLSSAVIILNLVEGGFFARFFENRFLAFTGKISYGLYLWHYPVFRYLRAGFHMDANSIFIFGGAIAYVLAVLSFTVIERPFLRLKRHFGGRSPESPAPDRTAFKLGVDISRGKV